MVESSVTKSGLRRYCQARAVLLARIVDAVKLRVRAHAPRIGARSDCLHCSDDLAIGEPLLTARVLANALDDESHTAMYARSQCARDRNQCSPGSSGRCESG